MLILGGSKTFSGHNKKLKDRLGDREQVYVCEISIPFKNKMCPNYFQNSMSSIEDEEFRNCKRSSEREVRFSQRNPNEKWIAKRKLRPEYWWTLWYFSCGVTVFRHLFWTIRAPDCVASHWPPSSKRKKFWFLLDSSDLKVFFDRNRWDKM